MITPADLKAKFPGAFDSLSDPDIQGAIDEAALMINESKWGTWYDLGLLYLSAHLLATFHPDASSGDAGAGGPVTSKRIGDVAVAYGSKASASPLFSSDLGSTAYGRRFLSLRLRVQGGPLVVEPASW